jgi:hypothetical protein
MNFCRSTRIGLWKDVRPVEIFTLRDSALLPVRGIVCSSEERYVSFSALKSDDLVVLNLRILIRDHGKLTICRHCGSFPSDHSQILCEAAI